MAQKIIGYVLTLVGILGIIVSGDGVQQALSLKLPAALSPNVVLISGIIVAGVGLALAVKSGSRKQPEEVPIYEGKNVVGYRRMKK